MSDEKKITERQLKDFVAEDPLGNKVYMGATDDVAKARDGVERFLKVLARPEFMDWDDEGKHVFVSDLSTVGDFGLDERQLARLSEELGFTVTGESYVKDIALTV